MDITRRDLFKGASVVAAGAMATAGIAALGIADEAQARTATVEVKDFGEGVLSLTLTRDNGAISAVEVTRSTTEATPGDEAVELIPDAIVAANSPDVDIVAGATFTSESIISAARAALAELMIDDRDNLVAWANNNGFVSAEDYRLLPEVDATSGATAVGGDTRLRFGYIDFSQEDLGKVVAEALAGPYTWGLHEPKAFIHKPEDFAPDADLSGRPQYRDMYVLGTCCNNIPNAATIELVYDPYTSMFYGSSEADTSKVAEFKANPYVTACWYAQMSKQYFDELGDNFPSYADYGKMHAVMVYGKLHAFTDEDFDGGEAEERVLRALDVYMPTYYGNRWPFKAIDSKLPYDYSDPEERAAKIEAAKTELKGVSAKYYIEPYRITFSIYSTFAPTAVNETSAWATYKPYAIKTSAASADNGFVESWQGITPDQYWQAAIEKMPGSVNAGFRYWYRSDTSWDFTWNEDGTELLAVNENPVPYRTPYRYQWLRDSFLDTIAELRVKWGNENQEKLVELFGADEEKTFERFALIADGSAVTAEDAKTKDLKLGEDYIIQQVTLPNYAFYGMTTPYCMSGVLSQQNYTPYPEAKPVQ